jgi:integrase
MPNSTTRTEPSKPRPDFPLFRHATGRWCKKVRGKLLYFGKVANDPEGETALAAWIEEKDYCLLHGRRPPTNAPGSVTVKDVVNQFLAHKENLSKSGELAQRTFDEYEATGKRLAKVFGKTTPVGFLTAADFGQLRAQIAKEWGPVRLGNEIQRIRSFFKFAFDSGFIDQTPRYGAEFKKPSAKVLRKARAAQGLRMFEREELLAVLDAATVNAKAMILLGINAGLGNSDVGCLPTEVVDLERGWINYPREKTGIERRIPLWPETVAAMKAVQAGRHQPTDPADARLFFISRHGKSYADTARNGYRVGSELIITLGKASIKQADGTQKPVARKGLSFYALRHTFQTVGEGSRDLAAVQAIMGHAASGSDMSATYRERVDDERLKAVVEHVRTWLFTRD